MFEQLKPSSCLQRISMLLIINLRYLVNFITCGINVTIYEVHVLRQLTDIFRLYQFGHVGVCEWLHTQCPSFSLKPICMFLVTHCPPGRRGSCII